MRKRVGSGTYRKIWERYNKACLLPWSHVHHIDGNPLNNGTDNLQAMMNYQHWHLHRPNTVTIFKAKKIIRDLYNSFIQQGLDQKQAWKKVLEESPFSIYKTLYCKPQEAKSPVQQHARMVQLLRSKMKLSNT